MHLQVAKAPSILPMRKPEDKQKVSKNCRTHETTLKRAMGGSHSSDVRTPYAATRATFTPHRVGLVHGTIPPATAPRKVQ